MKLHLVANPVSGKGRGGQFARIACDVLRNAGHDVALFEGSSEQETREFIASITDSDGLLVAGGDGLVHMAIQHLAGSRIPLGIIPSGTGNDAARSLGIPLNDPVAAATIIATRTASSVDLGRAQSDTEKRWFLQILSTGFDSVVNERANQYSWPTGTMKYNRAMLSLLPRFQPISYRMKTDHGEKKFEAMLVAIANGPSYGGGMLVCPEASFRDGLLDIMVLEPLGKLKFLALFPRVYKGSHISHPRVTTLRVASLTLEGSAVTYADGERVGELPLRVEVVPDALRVWSPNVP